MPELPEVETVVRDLRPHLVGASLRAVRVGEKKLRRPWKPAWEAAVLGPAIEAVDRRGKWILARLKDSGLLVVHLGMTGQLQIQDADRPAPPHTHFAFTLDGGARELRYTDIRRFGSLQHFADRGAWMASLDEPLGPEPWDLTPAGWRADLAKARRSLKAVLLDQGIVAGVGNIYADESLFRAGIRPTTIAADLSKPRAEKLRKSIIATIDSAIASRGSTIRNYVGGSGLKGGYQESFAAYGRTGKPCVKCGTLIECIRLAGRATHHCPRCQS